MGFFVYILANRPHGRLYVGRTNDLRRRLWQHKTKALPSFTAEHDVTRLVYFEPHHEPEAAWFRERRLKRWRREWKFNLIERDIPHWRDLASDWFAD